MSDGCDRCARLDHDRDHGKSCLWCGKGPNDGVTVVKGSGGRICLGCAELVTAVASEEEPPDLVDVTAQTEIRAAKEQVLQRVAAWEAEVVTLELELGHTLPAITEMAETQDSLTDGQAEGTECLACRAPNPTIPVGVVLVYHVAAACSPGCAAEIGARYPRKPVP